MSGLRILDKPTYDTSDMDRIRRVIVSVLSDRPYPINLIMDVTASVFIWAAIECGISKEQLIKSIELGYDEMLLKLGS